ncbi:hypothetical protein cyc_06953 [Cyclospora cayetanensis]|uniref:Uncharacterized protein n=1 Tax=Cyclospora cayetanensis TaxID=88456 RepID=A0A1D3D023_9EIME|nr:hypothetical protein cyc_06953 [Cyclospora cayetanensis]
MICPLREGKTSDGTMEWYRAPRQYETHYWFMELGILWKRWFPVASYREKHAIHGDAKCPQVASVLWLSIDFGGAGKRGSVSAPPRLPLPTATAPSLRVAAGLSHLTGDGAAAGLSVAELQKSQDMDPKLLSSLLVVRRDVQIVLQGPLQSKEALEGPLLRALPVLKAAARFASLHQLPPQLQATFQMVQNECSQLVKQFLNKITTMWVKEARTLQKELRDAMAALKVAQR